MLKTIQIIAIVQGLFLLFILFKRKRDYKTVNFWLLAGCILSVMLYAVGDDDYHLFLEDADWFLFHDTLVITLFFLFVRYYESNKEVFVKRDLLFFIPYLIIVIFQVLDKTHLVEDNYGYRIAHELLELAFLGMLVYTVYDILKKKKEKWLLVFILPLTLIFLIDEVSYLLTNSNEAPYLLDSYGIILAIIFLFYLVLYKLIFAPKAVLPKSDGAKYKSSTLQSDSIAANKAELIRLMEEERLFANNTLTVNDVAQRMGIPRQHLSEILNVHLKTGFQDFLNHYRVEAFIECLQMERYENFTLMGIAQEVGFSSKSSFNTIFKKAKGMTPSQFRKQLS